MHIVIFTGGFSPEPGKTINFFVNNKPDKVIVSDSGFDTLLKYNEFYSKNIQVNDFFYPSVITGDFDSVEHKDLITKYSSTIVEHPCDKDYSDTELAIEEAYKLCKEPSITLVGGDGGRVDHFLALYDVFSHEHRMNKWFCKEQYLYFMKEGKEIQVTGLSKNDYVSFNRLNNNYNQGYILSSGLQWEGPLFRKEGMASLSNRISDECRVLKLKACDTPFVLILPYTAIVLESLG